MLTRSLTPSPWRQVGLAVLPGGLFLAMSLAGDSLYPSVLIVLVVLLLAALWTMGRRRLSRPPVWSYVPLGLVAFLTLYDLLALGTGLWSALVPGSFVKNSLLAAVAILMLAAAGLFLTKDSGLCAGLLVLSAGVPFMAMGIEQVIYFYDNSFWTMVTGASEPVLFFIASPLWVMRSRSLGAQVAGLILPAGMYGLLLVGGLMQARGYSLVQSLTIAAPAMVLFLIVVCFVILYTQAAARGARWAVG